VRQNCVKCGRAYDDAQCWTICPHMPLDGTWRDGHGVAGETGADQEKRVALPGNAAAGVRAAEPTPPFQNGCPASQCCASPVMTPAVTRPRTVRVFD
jgi:hypothetical protein